MLKELKTALREFNIRNTNNIKFNDHKLVFNDRGEIHLYQTYGESYCKHWESSRVWFDSIEDCINWLNNN